MIPVLGSAAPLLQLEPPTSPGIWIESSLSVPGVKIPWLFVVLINARMRSLSASLIYGSISLAVKLWRANGGGLVGTGCVGQDSSPGASLFGTGRSSMGQIG